jgi:hypothetical protein
VPCFAVQDLSWFPMNKAVCLMMQEDVDDELDEYLRTSLKGVERDFDEKLGAFKENLLKSISRVEGALTFQPETDHKSLKSKSASLASMVDRKVDHTHEHFHESESHAAMAAQAAQARLALNSDSGDLMLGGGLENSVNDDGSVGAMTEASFGDSYSVVVVVEQILNLFVSRDSIRNLVCRIDCDVSTHNLVVSHVIEAIDENGPFSNSGGAEAGFLVSRIPSLGCYSVTFGKTNVAVDLNNSSTPRLRSFTTEEEELMVAEMSQSNKRVVFHGKLGDNIDSCTMSMVIMTEPQNDKSNSTCKLVASVDVPIAVLLDAAEAKCKIDILLQQSHGLPVPSAVAVLSVEVIGGDYAGLGLR